MCWGGGHVQTMAKMMCWGGGSVGACLDYSHNDVLGWWTCLDYG